MSSDALFAPRPLCPIPDRAHVTDCYFVSNKRDGYDRHPLRSLLVLPPELIRYVPAFSGIPRARTVSKV